MDPKVNMGPVINRAAGASIIAYIRSAEEEGAKIGAGGSQLRGGDFDRGSYIEPALISDVTQDMKVAIDEIFGPVLVSIPDIGVQSAAINSDYGCTE